MTIYSSGKHAKLTADEYPWAREDIYGNVMADRSSKQRAPLYGALDCWHPRPESDRPLTNPANPVLTAFREAVADGDLYADPSSWLVNLDSMDADAELWQHPRDAVLHAEKVLERLAWMEAYA
ncbi:hypothetical protein ACFWGP_05480 [Agromyces sp. NPDC127015]|uniref:hypothetical protein n=1 Tax=Agromyces sp. NPDC127015 TaxID=3347108 RepID=UPI003654F533